MKAKLVFEDWRMVGQTESIYGTPLGVELSIGDLHSGTTFKAKVIFDAPEIAREIALAFKHGAYPVFRLIPEIAGLGAIIGKWPGVETDEEITKALEELS